jgi:hypothetical protein
MTNASSVEGVVMVDCVEGAEGWAADQLYAAEAEAERLNQAEREQQRLQV